MQAVVETVLKVTAEAVIIGLLNAYTLRAVRRDIRRLGRHLRRCAIRLDLHDADAGIDTRARPFRLHTHDGPA